MLLGYAEIFELPEFEFPGGKGYSEKLFFPAHTPQLPPLLQYRQYSQVLQALQLALPTHLPAEVQQPASNTLGVWADVLLIHARLPTINIRIERVDFIVFIFNWSFSPTLPLKYRWGWVR